MKKVFEPLFFVLMLVLASTAFAFDDSGNATSLGDVSQVVTGLIFMTTNLMAVCFFLLGIGFSIGAIIRFRYHYKNPNAMPLMTPILMSFLAIIMFCFNAFNAWKQNEVFRGGKAPSMHITVPNYNPNQENQVAGPQQKTPIQALRDMEAAQKYPHAYSQAPQPNQATQPPAYQPPAGTVVHPSMPVQPYDPDFDDDDDDEEYAT